MKEQEETDEQRAARHALNQPLIVAFDDLRKRKALEPYVVEADDPLEGVRLFDSPATEEESKRRRHLRIFAEIAIDRTETIEARENAVRHLLACDPARAIGEFVALLNETCDFANMVYER